MRRTGGKYAVKVQGDVREVVSHRAKKAGSIRYAGPRAETSMEVFT